jgi:hypothetical protein
MKTRTPAEALSAHVEGQGRLVALAHEKLTAAAVVLDDARCDLHHYLSAHLRQGVAPDAGEVARLTSACDVALTQWHRLHARYDEEARRYSRLAERAEAARGEL